ncbi:MAG: hypothetical protein ACFCUU_14835 [Cyclobacteriaceae bacterium]
MSCSNSPEEKAKDLVSKSMGIDKKKLESISYYHIKVIGGALDGKEFSTPVYAQGGIDTRKVEGKEGSTISFMDTPQGYSNFRIIWNGNEATPLTSKTNPFGTNSYIELKLKVDDEKYSFISENGAYKIKSRKERTLTHGTGEKYTAIDVEAEFDGEFVEATSGEKVKIKGLVRGINPEN